MSQLSAARQAAITKQLNLSVKRVRLDYLYFLDKQRSDLAKIYTIAKSEVQEKILAAGDSLTRAREKALLVDIDGILSTVNKSQFEQAKRAAVDSAIFGQVAAATVLGHKELAANLGKLTFPLAKSNLRAVNAMLAADYSVLSDTIWKQSQAARKGIKHALSVGVAQGRSTLEISRQVSGYLVETSVSNKRYEIYMAKRDKLTISARSYEAKALSLRSEAAASVKAGRNANGLLNRAGIAEKAGKSYRLAAKEASTFAKAAKLSSNGLYVSMEANSWRMVRHMTNLAYREGYLAGALQYSNFVYQQWTLSTGHKCCDICDTFANYDNGKGAGIYKTQNYPGVPHIGCLCYPVPFVDWSKIKIEA